MRKLVLILVGSLSLQAGTILLNVTAPTAFSPTGTRWAFEFQLSDGDGVAQNNTVNISNFYSGNLTLDPLSLATNASVSGTLGTTLTMQDDNSGGPPTFVSDFYIEFTQDVASAPIFLQFLIDYTENGTGSPAPDLLSFYVYEVSPTFASVSSVNNGTLLELALSASPTILVQASDYSYTPTADAVPEPSTAISVVSCLAYVLFRRRKTKTPGALRPLAF